MSTSTSDRVEFRLASQQKSELEAASDALGLTTSAFVKQAALEAARRVLTEERQVRLSEDAWAKFVDAIDKPGDVNKGLADLLTRPSRFSTE